MSSDVRSLRDVNLDNNADAIAKSRRKIDATLGELGISVVDTVEYVDSTLFVLSDASMRHQDEVRAKFRNNKNRLSFEFATVATDEIIEGDGRTGGYLGRMPSKRTTMAIRRGAFKKLPRPILCSFLYQTCLWSLLTALLFVAYHVAIL